MTTILIILAAIVVVGVCLETTRHPHVTIDTSADKTENSILKPFDMWEGISCGGTLSDGSDGSDYGDPWGTTYDIWGNPDC